MRADGSDKVSSAFETSSDDNAAHTVIGLEASACAFDRRRASSRSSSATSLASTPVSALVFAVSIKSL
jgi:hypothetical protein